MLGGREGDGVRVAEASSGTEREHVREVEWIRSAGKSLLQDAVLP